MNTAIAEVSTVNHPVVSAERWIAARKSLLAHEKELTHLRDRIARERRERWSVHSLRRDLGLLHQALVVRRAAQG
jgi:predicted dithiol-disulfide oxidoreductase (DUF899 family)